MSTRIKVFIAIGSLLLVSAVLFFVVQATHTPLTITETSEKEDHQYITMTAAQAQTLSTVETIMNDVWDKENHRLFVSGTGGASSGASAWGDITGTLSDQTDLYNSLSYSSMVIRADVQAGADAGLKIAAAIALLPSGIGGIVDATHFTNSQNATAFTIPPGVTVLLSPVLYTITSGTPIIVNQGARLIGYARNSPGSTTLKMSNGGNSDVVKCINSDGQTTSYWHHGEVRNLRIDGNKANNTTGHGLSVYSVAETSVIQMLSISNAAQAGLFINGSQSGTGSIENITVNSNGLYGVRFQGFTSAITLKAVGGDANPTTFSINSGFGGGILIIDPKSEGATGPHFTFSGSGSKVSLTLIGGNMLNTPGDNNTIVQIDADVTSDHNIQMLGVVSAASTKIIDDLKNGTSVTTAEVTTGSFFTYTGGAKQTRIDETGLAVRDSSAETFASVNAMRRRALVYDFGEPGGTALTAGSLLTKYYTIPFACTLKGWNILADSGTVTMKAWKKAAGTALPTVSDSINTSGVSLASGSVVQSAVMTDFTSVAVAVNDILAVNLSAVSSAGYVSVTLNCEH